MSSSALCRGGGVTARRGGLSLAERACGRISPGPQSRATSAGPSARLARPNSVLRGAVAGLASSRSLLVPENLSLSRQCYGRDGQEVKATDMMGWSKTGPVTVLACIGTSPLLREARGLRGAGAGLRTPETRGLRRWLSSRSGGLRKEEREKNLGETGSKSSPHQPSARPERSTAATAVSKVLPALPKALTEPHENIYTIPNLLTFSRLIAAPFIGYAILHDAHVWALGLFIYAGASDLLDGWIARRWGQQTVVGSVVDPMADKTLMTVLTICLAAKGALPVWVAAIILGRDVGLAISAIYYRWISLPPPKTFTRYWDFSLPSAEVRPTTISKYNTFLQLALMGSTVLAPVLAVDVSVALTGLQYIVAATTVWSGLSYIFTNNAVKILTDSQKQTQGSENAADEQRKGEKDGKS